MITNIRNTSCFIHSTYVPYFTFMGEPYGIYWLCILCITESFVILISVWSNPKWLGRGSRLKPAAWNQAFLAHISHSELILGLRPANERRLYFVTPSLIGWAQAYNQPCHSFTQFGLQQIQEHHTSFLDIDYWNSSSTPLYSQCHVWWWRTSMIVLG